MFCIKCGKQLADGTRFCPDCGTEQTGAGTVQVQAADPMAAKAQERTVLMQNLQNSTNVMAAIDAQENLIIETTKKRDMCEKKTKAYGRVLGYIVLGFFIGGFLASIGAGIIDTFNTLTGRGDPSMGFFGIYMLVCFAVPMVWLLRRSANQRKKDRAMVVQLEQELHSQLDALANMKTDNSLSWLPEDYRFSTAYYRILDYVKNARASTLSEAINLYENEMHQLRMEKA